MVTTSVKETSSNTEDSKGAGETKKITRHPWDPLWEYLLNEKDLDTMGCGQNLPSEEEENEASVSSGSQTTMDDADTVSTADDTYKLFEGETLQTRTRSGSSGLAAWVVAREANSNSRSTDNGSTTRGEHYEDETLFTEISSPSWVGSVASHILPARREDLAARDPNAIRMNYVVSEFFKWRQQEMQQEALGRLGQEPMEVPTASSFFAVPTFDFGNNGDAIHGENAHQGKEIQDKDKEKAKRWFGRWRQGAIRGTGTTNNANSSKSDNIDKQSSARDASSKKKESSGSIKAMATGMIEKRRTVNGDSNLRLKKMKSGRVVDKMIVIDEGPTVELSEVEAKKRGVWFRGAKSGNKNSKASRRASNQSTQPSFSTSGKGECDQNENGDGIEVKEVASMEVIQRMFCQLASTGEETDEVSNLSSPTKQVVSDDDSYEEQYRQEQARRVQNKKSESQKREIIRLRPKGLRARKMANDEASVADTFVSDAAFSLGTMYPR